MQQLIRSGSNRVSSQRSTSEAARAKKITQNIGLVVFIVFLMAVFVITNMMMLESFKEQPAFGFQRDERHALGVGPLLRDMLKRRGFHRIPWRRKGALAGPRAAEAAEAALAAEAGSAANTTVAEVAAQESVESLANAAAIEQEPPKEAGLDDEVELSERPQVEETASPEVLDPEEAGVSPEVLAVAGGDADLALAAEAAADAEAAAAGDTAEAPATPRKALRGAISHEPVVGQESPLASPQV